MDFQAARGKAWLTDDMPGSLSGRPTCPRFGVLGQVKHLRSVRVDGQKLLSERCFWFLRRSPGRSS